MGSSLERAERVLVTGAAGFIGGHLCEALAAEGRFVVGLDNFDPYYSPAEKHTNVGLIERAGAKFVELDLRDHDSLVEQVDAASFDVVVHLAAMAGVRNSVRWPRKYFDVNLVGSQNVLDACRNADVGRLVMASTSSVYGNTETIPFVEDDPCIAPLHPYAATKRSAELLAQTYEHLYGLQTSVLRFFTVYGERGRPDMMPRLLVDSISSGVEIPLFDGPLARDWTHVSDIVAGIIGAVDRPQGFATFNLGRGEPVSLAAFIEALETVSGGTANLVRTPRPASEMLTTFADNSRAVDALGFAPSISVEEGVARLWDWWERRGGVGQ